MEESNSSKTLPQNPKPPTPAPSSSSYNRRDFLFHLEAYLAKRDGVDKLLKISRYASKIILASSLLSQSHPLHPRLKSFESSVGVSRKAFRLGKFVQDLNALRSTRLDYRSRSLLSVVAYGGEGLYYFVEQFVWLSKTGFIDARRSPSIQKISAWAELIGYFGSISLKAIDLREILDEEERLLRSAGADGCDEEAEKLRRRLREKGLLKKLSIVQDIADGLMAAADVRDGKGWLSGPLLLASAGLLSALISTHKNWISC